MKRKQLYLPAELDALLAERAQREAVTEAAVVRAALGAYLVAEPETPDPLLALVGMARSRAPG